MLGSIRNNPWKWTTFGKHPAVRDYFHLGEQNAFTNALSEWMDKGHQKVLDQTERGSSPIRSWRFCLKGHKKSHLLCGVTRDSCDSLGRPYPIMVLGSGSVEKWESNWDLLPYGLESTWCDMERLSTRRYADLKQLEGDLNMIQAPPAEGSGFLGLMEKEEVSADITSTSWSERTSPWTGGDSPWSKGIGWAVSRWPLGRGAQHGRAGTPLPASDPFPGPSKPFFFSNEVFLISLDSSPFPNSYTVAGQWLSRLKGDSSSEPNAFFIGGTTGTTCILVFKRPIAANDFVMLWTISSTGIAEYGFEPAL